MARHIVSNDFEFVSLVHAYNHLFNEPPLPDREIEGMLRKQFDYKLEDKDVIRQRIITLLITSEEPLDIKTIVKECRAKPEFTRAVIKEMVERGEVIKPHRGYYALPTWPKFVKIKDIQVGQKLPYKVKYFDNVATFKIGDILLIGARPKDGKTTLAMNFAKYFLDQGVETYYYYTESGGRFKRYAELLGCMDLNVTFLPDPEKIILMPNAANILDWLMIEDKAATDLIFKSITRQLEEKGGFCIVFMQLKEDFTFFAPNMVKQFPALVARFKPLNPEKTRSEFIIDVVRQAKGKVINKINCVFNPETCRLELAYEEENDYF